MIEVDDKEEDGKRRVEFHYIKSNSFRVLHVDGAIGGITPRKLIHFALYNERPAIPQLGVRYLDEASGELTEEKYTGREGIVRELEADVILNVDTAVQLRDFLDRRLQDIAKLDATEVEQS